MLFLSNTFRSGWHGALALDVSAVDMQIQEAFRDVLPWGLEADIDLFHYDPVRITDADVIQDFLTDLCNKIGEPRFGDPLFTHVGTSSLSLIQQLGKSVMWSYFIGPDAAVCLHIFSDKPYPPLLFFTGRYGLRRLWKRSERLGGRREVGRR